MYIDYRERSLLYKQGLWGCGGMPTFCRLCIYCGIQRQHSWTEDAGLRSRTIFGRLRLGKNNYGAEFGFGIVSTGSNR